MGWRLYSFRTLRALPKEAFSGQARGGPGGAQTQARSDPGHLLLELVGQEQELAPREPPDVELAEVLELVVDLLLGDPGPPPDTEDEDGGSGTGVIWTGKVLEDEQKDRRAFPPFPLTTCAQFENPERDGRKGRVWGWERRRRE